MAGASAMLPVSPTRLRGAFDAGPDLLTIPLAAEPLRMIRAPRFIRSDQLERKISEISAGILS